MKKTLALLAVAAMLISAGCGKTDKPAAEVQQNASEAVEQVQQTATEVKENAAETVDNAANNVQAMIDDAKTAMTNIKNGTGEKTVAALDGIVPGINYETVTEMYGEPISFENQIVQFSNGVDLKVVDNVVQEVSTMYDGIYTPAQVAVGMEETILKETYGDATSVENGDNGAVTYKYSNKDNKRALEFVTRDGRISEIKCILNK